MKITATIEITGIEGWDVNWNLDNDIIKELARLEYDIKGGISKYCGIDLSNLEVNAQLTTEDL